MALTQTDERRGATVIYEVEIKKPLHIFFFLFHPSHRCLKWYPELSRKYTAPAAGSEAAGEDRVGRHSKRVRATATEVIKDEEEEAERGKQGQS